jgi:sugar/nucleoside kinase (ribokinase family)
MSRVVVVGDVMWDVVVRPRGPVAESSDTPAAIRVTRGGAAANLAVALREARNRPADVVYVGSRGADAMGERFEQELQRHNVVPLLRVTGNATGTLVSMVDERGERTMLTDRGANDALCAEDVLGALTEDLLHLHLSGYTVLSGDNATWIAHVIDRAHERGATVSVDVCSWQPLQAFGPALFRSTIGNVDVLAANEAEAVQLVGASDYEEALQQLSDHHDEVVVTIGVRGAVAQRDGIRSHAPSQAVDVVDTTGAGDATLGTYLAHRLDGHDPAGALRAAMVKAASVVAGIGSAG